MTWQEYKKGIRERGGIAKEVLNISEASAQIAGTMYLAREQQGVSQRELAKRAGLAQSVVARFEIGETSPQLDTLIKMLAPLGLKLQAMPIEMNYQANIVFMDSLIVALATGKAKLVKDMRWTDSEVKEVNIHV